MKNWVIYCSSTAKNPSSALLKLHFDYRTNYDHNDSLSKNVIFTPFTCCLEALCITFSSHCYFSILFHFCPFFWPSDLSQQLLSHANHANVTKLPSRSWAGLLFHTSCHSNITLEPFRVWHLRPCCIKGGLKRSKSLTTGRVSTHISRMAEWHHWILSQI